jgi:hypothetical protein
MATTFPRTRVPGITPLQWKRARRLFAEEGANIEPAQLCSATGMNVDAAYALVLSTYAMKLADLFILVKHSCCEHPVAVRPYKKGFQPVPWVCPECGEKVSRQSELGYDIRAVLRSPIRFTADG